MTEPHLEIKQSESDNQGEFYIEKDQERVGQLNYLVFGSGRIIIQHTEVDREFSGKGMARRLVDAVVSYARESNRKVVPICPYAKALMRRHPEVYGDIRVG